MLPPAAGIIGSFGRKWRMLSVSSIELGRGAMILESSTRSCSSHIDSRNHNPTEFTLVEAGWCTT